MGTKKKIAVLPDLSDMSLMELFNNTSIFTLPAANAKNIKPKRYVGKVDLSILKAQQKQAYDELKAFVEGDGVEDGNSGLHLLEGFAGTGKTFLMNLFIEWFLSEKRTVNVAMSAPTNKAVKVMIEAAEYTHTNLTYSTIHKLLGLKEVIDKFGKQTFKQDRMIPPAIDMVELLVIDEVSQLSDEIFEMLMPYVNQGSLKIIFVGDPAQIPPVGKVDCIPLRPEMQKKLKIGKSSLTEILRQALDNPIIATTFKVRENLKRPTALAVKETHVLDSGMGVFHIFKSRSDDDAEFFESILQRYFVSPNFDGNADFMKVIAWRNKTVNALNTIIRRMIYGDEASEARIVKGEKLIANDPIFEGKTVLFTTNDELTVEDLSIKHEHVNNGQFTINYYQTRVTSVTADGNKNYGVVRIVHEDSIALHEQIQQMLADVAKAQKPGSFAASRGWEDFYDFKKHFASVNYNYAITAHKAQGSTYDNTMVLEFDIDRNNNVVERNRIKYTAFSRPRYKLFVVS